MATKGNTIVASTLERHTSKELIFDLFATQVALHGKNIYNLILDLDDDGLLYTTSDDINEIKKYMKKYYKKRYIRTDGINFDNYFKRIIIKYTKTIVRDCYIIYINGKNNRGENKIMGVNDEMKEILEQKLRVLNKDPELQLKIMMFKLLGVKI